MSPRSVALRAVAVALVLGCGDAAGPETRDQAVLAPAGDIDYATASPTIREKLDNLRKRLAPFHRFQAAVDAGWSTQLTGCLTDPQLGGMGFHYAKAEILDGVARVKEPEALLYEPQPDGKLRLVAVEYIIPFGAWTRSHPPQLLGQNFKRNEVFGVWALHIWLFRHNPSGRFADWNPHVHCP